MRRGMVLLWSWRRGMVCKIGFLALTPIFLSASIGSSAPFSPELKVIYAVNKKPSFLAVIDAESAKITRQIPIEPNVTAATFSLDKRYLYILHNGRIPGTWLMPDQRSFLTIVDTLEGIVLKKVPLGWNVEQLVIPKTGDRIYCLGISKDSPDEVADTSKSTVVGGSRASSVKGQKELNPLVFEYTTAYGKQKVYDWWPNMDSWTAPLPASEKARALTAWLTAVDVSGGHAIASRAIGPAGTRFAISQDGNSIFILRMPILAKPFQGRIVMEKEIRKAMQAPVSENAFLQIFGRDLTQPSKEVPLTGWPRLMLFSPDGAHLYLWDPGLPGESDPGKEDKLIRVLDTKTNSLVASHPILVPGDASIIFSDEPTGEISLLGLHPAKKKGGIFYRIKGSELVETRETADIPKYFMRPKGFQGRILVTEREFCILSDGEPSNARCAVVDPSQDASNTLKSWPEDAIYLSSQQRFILRAKDRVGFIDSQTGALEQVVTTGRTNVKIGKIVGSVIGAAAMSFGMSAAFSGMLPGSFYYIAIPGLGANYHGLCAAPDGSFAWALNSYTQDITVIDAKAGKSGSKIAIGSDCFGVNLTSDGRHLVAECMNHLALIDTEKNVRIAEFGGIGRPAIFHEISGTNKAVVLGEKGCIIINTIDGKVEKVLKDLKKPILLIDPADDKLPTSR